MSTLHHFYPGNHETNETILVYSGGDDGGSTSVRFHQLGRTREVIVAEYAPDLTLWLRKYLAPSTQPGDDLTDEELAAWYQRNLAALHAPLLADTEGGKECVQRFERIRKKAELCVIGALRLCHGIDSPQWSRCHLPGSRCQAAHCHPGRLSLDHARSGMRCQSM